MKSIIYNNRVIAIGDYTETDLSFESPESIIPKIVVQGAYLLDAVPAGSSEYGWNYIDGEFVAVDPPPPPPSLPVPESVTPRQARLILALTPSDDPEFATMLAKVEAAFDALQEPQKTVARITWEYSTLVERKNPLINQLQNIIGFTNEQIDDLFIQASKL